MSLLENKKNNSRIKQLNQISEHSENNNDKIKNNKNKAKDLNQKENEEEEEDEEDSKNNNVSEDGGSGGETSSGEQEHLDISYPTGKTKATIVTGDIVTIGTEQFNVIKTDSNNIYLLARYNLTVGNKIHFYNGRSDILGAHTASEETYGKQC